jgi:hypothetical protein
MLMIGTARRSIERDAEAAHLLGRVRMVGHDHRDGHRRFAAAVPPQQIEQAVV